MQKRVLTDRLNIIIHVNPLLRRSYGPSLSTVSVPHGILRTQHSHHRTFSTFPHIWNAVLSRHGAIKARCICTTSASIQERANFRKRASASRDDRILFLPMSTTRRFTSPVSRYIFRAWRIVLGRIPVYSSISASGIPQLRDICNVISLYSTGI